MEKFFFLWFLDVALVSKLSFKDTMNILGFFFSVGANIPYILSVIKNPETRPTVSGWVCWVMIDLSLLWVLYHSNEPYYQIAAFSCGSILILFTSIITGKAKWKEVGVVDLIGIVFVCLAVAKIYTAGDKETIIIVVLVAGFIATVPLIWNLWKDPTREPLIGWIMVIIGGALAVAGIKEYTILGSATQLFFFAIQLGIMGLIARRWL